MGQNPGGQQTNGGQPAQQSQQSTDQQSSQQPNQQGQQDQQGQQTQQTQQHDTGERIASWFTETVVRTAVAVFGVALLLFALGQLAGVELLSIVGEFLTSSTGAWLFIAFFGMLLLVAASKSWNISRQ
ncbi:hypothetical protein [Halorarius litoreus]|uniref:hypothetical protein n=1 Tax=Halorarius litoreus TaxID=2962676 RepID=UPI0020CDE282|nr:hypothetical protein [Halorarius litoreus]